MKLRATVLSCLLSVALGVMGALARTPTVRAEGPSQGDADLARTLFEQGVRAAEKGELQEAQTLFERSRAVVPTNLRTLLNLAIVRSKLGRWVLALETLDELEPIARRQADDRALQKAARIRTKLHALLGVLEVEVTPAEASVLVDDRPLRRGADGVVRLPPGTHVLRASAPDFEPAQTRVSLRAGATTRQTLHLQPVKPEVPSARLAASTVANEPRVDTPSSERGGAERGALRQRHKRWRRALWISGAVLIAGAAGVTGALLARPEPAGKPF